MKGKILFIERSLWITIERLPLRLSQAGFQISFLCQPESIVNHLPAADKIHWTEADFLSQVESAVESFAPDLLICLDEATIHAFAAASASPEFAAFAARHGPLLQRTFGDLKTLKARCQRRFLCAPVVQERIRLPRTITSRDPAELLRFAEDCDWRIAAKREGSFGGQGVKKIFSEAEFRQALPEIVAVPEGCILQQWIEGEITMGASIARDGKLLSSFSMRRLEGIPLGYSTVVKPISSPGMDETAAELADILQLTGFFSCDFIVDKVSGIPYLLELNPRTVTVFHLDWLFGLDTAQAVQDLIDGQDHFQAAKLVDRPLEVALFPKALVHRPESVSHRAGFLHDVPWDSPEILAAYRRLYPKKIIRWAAGDSVLPRWLARLFPKAVARRCPQLIDRWIQSRRQR